MNNTLVKQYVGQVNPVIHAPARFLLLGMLKQLEYADFKFLLRETGLTKGNLSVHMSKLENAGYIDVSKTIENKMTLTTYKITELGKIELEKYKRQMRSMMGG